MATLTITVGLPGSGKTTWARGLRSARVNRDDLRRMMRREWPWGDAEALRVWEARLTLLQEEMVDVLLGEGADVVVDDTNLRPEHRRGWRALAAAREASFRTKLFLDVPLETCLARNEGRRGAEGFVPPQRIRGMWEEFVRPYKLGEGLDWL